MLTSFHDVLKLPRSRFFFSERERGDYRCGNPDGYYLRGADPEEASYDTGNNKAIALQGLNGELKQLTIFKSSYYADSIPGVWVHKDRITAGPFRFTLNMAGNTLYLPDVNTFVRTDLVECALPITSYTLEGLDIGRQKNALYRAQNSHGQRTSTGPFKAHRRPGRSLRIRAADADRR